MTERLPNPFKTAIRQSGSMSVVLKADDLIAAHPSIMRADAERLLIKLGPILANTMIHAGVDLALKLHAEAGQ